MKRILIFLTFMSASFFGHAQTAADSVKTAINQLFDAMKNADAAGVKAAFGDSAVLQTIRRDKQGKQVVVNEAIAGFADFVGKTAKGDADERISFDVIKIDGPLAIAWTPYQFYFKGKFSHCGVNSFQLVRLNGVWKIQYLIDTRRTKGCE